MSRTPSQVSNDILAKLRITDPMLSLEIGTPERSIVDACAEAISESYIDANVQESALDIDTKTGIELDQFVGIFGFGRLSGRNATGVLRFSLLAAAVNQVDIPIGTQVYVPSSTAGPTVYFATTQSGAIPKGATYVDIPAQCTDVGVQGNVGSNTIVGIGTNVGITQVTNTLPFVNGSDTETDEQLRARFKQQFLRNIAGTADFYMGLCMTNTNVSRVQVLGPINRWSEQLQITSGSATSSIQNAKYIWPQSDFLSQNLGTVNEVYYTPGVAYFMDPVNNPPVVSVLDASKLPNGSVVDLSYEYCSSASRNDPANGITNKVDVLINGSQPLDTLEQTVISSQTLNTTTGSPYNINNFVRTVTGTPPVTGHRFQRLGSVPVLAFPSQITVGSTTYNLGTDYVLLSSKTPLRGSERAIEGLEWLTTAPTAGAAVTYTYTYNRLPELLNSLIKQTKQITTDVLVHQARQRNLRFNLVIIYRDSQTVAQTDTMIANALSAWLQSLPFGAWIQRSDVEQVVHNVVDVDAVRIAKSTDDATNYGIQVMNGSTVSQTFTGDFQLFDDELAVYDSVKILRRSQNTYGSIDS
ncbi:baseplate J/gp47 family protein [Streptomyces sp. CoH17]|uniref:baseplate J/gp47 family protein n=1 Tax=Streptomyces sp. CoH17 TaxID=2992806 RepID=UPI00226FF435|nr:baseplate J/gp47 family protein [Streptomyces sp. CoH17]